MESSFNRVIYVKKAPSGAYWLWFQLDGPNGTIQFKIGTATRRCALEHIAGVKGLLLSIPPTQPVDMTPWHDAFRDGDMAGLWDLLEAEHEKTFD